MNRRAAAWLAWSLVALSVAFVLGGFILARTTQAPDPALPYGGADDGVILTSVTVLAFSLVGAVVASGRPRNAIGWLFCAVGLVEALDTLARGYAEYWIAGGWGPRGLGETAAWFASWAWVVSVGAPATFLLLLFPDGRLPSARWRPVAWCAGLGIAGFFAGFALRAGPLEDFPQIANPYGVDSPIVGVAAVAGGLVVVGSFVTSAISIIVRARHASSEQRQQIKWIAYGGAVVVGAMLVGGLVSIWSMAVSIGIISVALLGMPLFTGIAIVRHRLYDIDLLINRTLVYAALTVMLAAAYVGSVVSLQYVFRALTGGESQLAIVASTLAIAALFSPLRRRIQTFIDRRFYRRRYDARKTLEAFSAKLRDETDLEALNDDLVGVVAETMQPEHVGLWLRPEMGANREERG
ncbi:MAG TPA: hypothetical protein VHF70_00535 [Rubrobacteraceae bacterium]|nr:hypothetical protein [Rubrobacteraceae bacterium]